MHLVINYSIVAVVAGAAAAAAVPLAVTGGDRFYNVDPGSTDLATGHVLAPTMAAVVPACPRLANLKFLLYFIVVDRCSSSFVFGL